MIEQSSDTLPSFVDYFLSDELNDHDGEDFDYLVWTELSSEFVECIPMRNLVCSKESFPSIFLFILIRCYKPASQDLS
jgi:hypothetical protein